MLASQAQRTGHAVVVGASMAGLLAARVLTETFDRVTIVDRDHLPDEPLARRGVPQARHAHGLLARGREILEDLFPGLTDALVTEHGAVLCDSQRDVAWFNDGHLLRQAPSDLQALSVSRPLLEWYVRTHVAPLPQVTIVPGAEALGLVADETKEKITGVRLLVAGAESSLDADLVVIATGRSNRGPTWLTELGYAAPEEQKVDAGLTYVSASYRRKPDDHPGTAVVVGLATDNPRGGVVLAVEDDRWMTTLMGMGDDVAPTDPAGYLAYAHPELHAVIADAELIEQPHKMRLPASTWRRYDKLRRFPAGLVVVGDAMCAINPAYAQGMTTAAVEAAALRECLAAGRDDLARRYFRKAASIIAIPWSIAVTADLRFPNVVGPRTAQVRFLNWYIARLHRVAARDAAVGRAFLRVANLIDPPQRLMAPGIAIKVLRG
jgi:2-polyprenyl-6-methoxyphenol hydroxylase-like FAD-dependent oxidoreductase